MLNEKALRWSINIAAFVVLMDLSAVNVALPEMRSYFQLSVSIISLVLMLSMLTATSSALFMGKISQMVSPQKMLILAFSAFGITTFLSGLIRDFTVLLIFRFFQGFAEAALYIIGPALIKRYISPEKQATAYGQWMMSTGIGISIGPLVGGYLVSLYSWPVVFFINILPVLVGLWFSFRIDIQIFISNKEKFDFYGAILSFAFLACLIAGINLGKHIGWNSAQFFFIASLLFFLAFLYRENKFAFPVLALKLFRFRNFWLASLGFLIFFVVNVGSRFLQPFYFEEGRGFDTEYSGVLLAISPAIMALISPFTAFLQQRFGTKTLVVLGNLFLFASVLMFSFWDSESSFSHLIISMIVLGAGMGFFYSAATTIGMQSLPINNFGMGSSVIASSKSMGKLIGVLLFALLFSSFFQNMHADVDIALEAKTIFAIQKVFVFATIISFFSLLLSFFFKTENRK